MKKSILALIAIFVVQPTFAGQDRGGGDLCERRIKDIRDDLKVWINKGGHRNMKMPKGVSHEFYKTSMLDQISKAEIQCVGPDDEGYPVVVFGKAKTCAFDKSDVLNITCDQLKFMNPNITSEDGQYELIHHEFAGAGDIEIPVKGDSNYDQSNNITKFLEEVKVKKLAVKKLKKKNPLSIREIEKLYAYAFSTEIDTRIYADDTAAYGGATGHALCRNQERCTLSDERRAKRRARANVKKETKKLCTWEGKQSKVLEEQGECWVEEVKESTFRAFHSTDPDAVEAIAGKTWVSCGYELFMQCH